MKKYNKADAVKVAAWVVTLILCVMTILIAVAYEKYVMAASFLALTVALAVILYAVWLIADSRVKADAKIKELEKKLAAQESVLAQIRDDSHALYSMVTESLISDSIETPKKEIPNSELSAARAELGVERFDGRVSDGAQKAMESRDYVASKSTLFDGRAEPKKDAEPDGAATAEYVFGTGYQQRVQMRASAAAAQAAVAPKPYALYDKSAPTATTEPEKQQAQSAGKKEWIFDKWICKSCGSVNYYKNDGICSHCGHKS